VAEASDGKQAVEVIPQVKPDVVLLDMRMPVMSGLETLQYLSERGELPPTIILTTFDDDQLVLAGTQGRRARLPAQGCFAGTARGPRSRPWRRVDRWCSRW
jgi:CheY-like chemotaxis protein